MVKALSIAGALLMWAAFQPVGIGALIFFAMLCWLMVIATEKELPAKSYRYLYLGSAIAWLALLQGIRLAYWPLYGGWIALSLYIAIYIPIFVLVSRYLVHRWRWPLGVAAPVVWAGCELLRCYVMTGFGGCLLSHAMVEHPSVIQLASHFGPQLLSGFYVLMSVTLFEMLRPLPFIQRNLVRSAEEARPFEDKLGPSKKSPDTTTISNRKRWLTISVQGLVIACGIAWSVWEYRAGLQLESQQPPLLKVALIQENAETRFEFSPERGEQSLERYKAVTTAAGAAHPDLDLVVWPESIFTPMEAYFDWDGKRMPETFADYVGDPRSAYENARFYKRYSVQRLEWMQKIATGQRDIWGKNHPPFDANDASLADLPALLLGVSRFRVREDGFHRFNSAVFKAKGTGQISFYDKRKLVMFGEYIPFAEKLPHVYDALGMAVLAVGERWEAFEVDGVKIAPSICFEDMLPQAMQSQTSSLIAQGKAPDVLINITNDGWFRGSSMLDHHFACAAFTAVENRRPMLVAANTGISTWVTGGGVVKAKSAKLAAEAVIAEPRADGRWGLWQSIGDWPACFCAVPVALALIAMLWQSQVSQYRKRRSALATDAQSS